MVVAGALVSALPSVTGPAFESEPLLVSAPGDPADPAVWFQPGERNQGTEAVATALATLALAGNPPLYVSDGWGRTGPVVWSDHHVLSTNAWAFDLAVRGESQPSPATELAARRIAAALAHPDWGGGDLRTTIDGYRFQLLWRVAGHFDHVHVGVRRDV